MHTIIRHFCTVVVDKNRCKYDSYLIAQILLEFVVEIIISVHSQSLEPCLPCGEWDIRIKGQSINYLTAFFKI